MKQKKKKSPVHFRTVKKSKTFFKNFARAYIMLYEVYCETPNKWEAEYPSSPVLSRLEKIYNWAKYIVGILIYYPVIYICLTIILIPLQIIFYIFGLLFDIAEWIIFLFKSKFKAKSTR